VRRLRSLINSTGKRVLNLLEAGYVRLRNIVVKIAYIVVEDGVNNKGGMWSRTGRFGFDVRADTAKLTNMTIAAFGQT